MYRTIRVAASSIILSLAFIYYIHTWHPSALAQMSIADLAFRQIAISALLAHPEGPAINMGKVLMDEPTHTTIHHWFVVWGCLVYNVRSLTHVMDLRLNCCFWAQVDL